MDCVLIYKQMKHTAERVETYARWVKNVVMEHALTWIRMKHTVELVETHAQ
jgi:hypothetical protein